MQGLLLRPTEDRFGTEQTENRLVTAHLNGSGAPKSNMGGRSERLPTRLLREQRSDNPVISPSRSNPNIVEGETTASEVRASSVGAERSLPQSPILKPGRGVQIPAMPEWHDTVSGLQQRPNPSG